MSFGDSPAFYLRKGKEHNESVVELDVSEHALRFFFLSKITAFPLCGPFVRLSAPSVTEYSDENMMQPYNLAVCFGPSLVRCGKDDDAVTLQPQINALVNNMIVQHESIFPSQRELQGPVYEKCMTLEQDDW